MELMAQSILARDFIVSAVCDGNDASMVVRIYTAEGQETLIQQQKAARSSAIMAFLRKHNAIEVTDVECEAEHTDSELL